ncbi:protein of unknown function DUF441 [Desulforamulus reducens MI-1]|uniref:UPF0756 membrane protein Dred_1676 n=1 Tax=Desulforamulus reducens (strain ATCC BAA-1160 / DSM 100696 / MI-1) TaxID=349161 RepID=Y1676_DESRM|nr:DUF441 domain-containing protein [Desulforamulus reducens]A4J550.1 RecName: Full=UPF0756 membrane protein Dred_1676 [Desulforamulus reducens MI-1]ABO50203.1 protein of unknown function DUF441 [Desulforamulus reducens MI-1]
MYSGEMTMVILLLIGLVAQSNLIAICASVLLIVQFSKMDFLFPYLETHGLELGLLFLLLSILVPIATDRVTTRDLLYNVSSLPGFLSIVGGILATHLNSEGLKLMQIDPSIIFGLIVGSVIGIIFFNGQPVGPLMAAGVAALFIEVLNWFH